MKIDSNSILELIRSSRSCISIIYDVSYQEVLFDSIDKLLIISPMDYKYGEYNEFSFDYNRRDMKISVILSHEATEVYNIVNLDNLVANETEESSPNHNINALKRSLVRKIASSSYSLSREKLKIKTVFISKKYPSMNDSFSSVNNSVGYESDVIIKLENDEISVLKNFNLPLTV